MNNTKFYIAKVLMIGFLAVFNIETVFLNLSDFYVAGMELMEKPNDTEKKEGNKQEENEWINFSFSQKHFLDLSLNDEPVNLHRFRLTSHNYTDIITPPPE